jgi:phospholipid/cholesterol/gamma-HCH transport system substrate-binding protein
MEVSMERAKTLTWTELRVGLVMVASLVVLAFTILYIGGGGADPFARKYRLKALMSDVNGLKPGAPVRVGGVEVGSVTGVQLGGPEQAGLVEVEMRLDARVRGQVTTESLVTLGSLGLLGEKAVDISSSKEGTPVGDDGYVRAAAEDPFKGLLTNASDSTAYLRRILARIDAGEGLLGKALRDDELYNRMTDVGERLQKVLVKLDSKDSPLGRMVQDKEMAEQLSASVKGLEAVVTRMDSGEGTFGVLSRDKELSDNLKALTASVNALSGRVEKGEGTVGKLFTEDALYVKLDQITTRLDAVTARLEAGEGTAGKVVHDPALYDNMNGVVKDVRQLIADIRADPHRYLRVKMSLF